MRHPPRKSTRFFQLLGDVLGQQKASGVDLFDFHRRLMRSPDGLRIARVLDARPANLRIAAALWTTSTPGRLRLLEFHLKLFGLAGDRASIG